MLHIDSKGRLRDGTRCQETFHAEESHVGKSLCCPACGTLNTIQSDVASGSIPAAVARITRGRGRKRESVAALRDHPRAAAGRKRRWSVALRWS